MNKIIISLLLISFLCIIGQLIGSFFAIPLSYYMPILMWFIALCLFDIFLERQHKNIFFTKIE